MSSRPNRNETYIEMALILSERSTCWRRRVGCILVDKHNRILSTGYNGVPAGFPHCIDEPCTAAGLPVGEGLDRCRAIHAEQNALMYCPDIFKIHTAICTTFPCAHCQKMLMGTSCQTIVYRSPYDPEIRHWKRGIECL